MPTRLVLIIIVLLISNRVLAASPTLPEWHEGFVGKLTIALTAAVLGFVANYVLSQINRRREPRQQLSYDIATNAGIASPHDGVKDKVEIRYDGEVITNLYHVSCHIENTGNTLVKDQQLRFSLTRGEEIRDDYFNPEPIPELQAKKVEKIDSKNVRYFLGHLEKEQSVDITLVTTGSTGVEVEIYPFNEAGNVEFLPRSLRSEQDEAYHSRRFIFLFILLWILPPLMYLIPGELGSMMAALMRIVIVISLFPHIGPFADFLFGAIHKVTIGRRVETRVQAVELSADVIDIKTVSDRDAT